MIEVTVANFNFGVVPLEDNAKQINVIHQPSMTVYHFPFSEEAIEKIVNLLQTPNEELSEEIEKKVREAKAQEAGLEIATPDQMPQGPGPNGGEPFTDARQ